MTYEANIKTWKIWLAIALLIFGTVFNIPVLLFGSLIWLGFQGCKQRGADEERDRVRHG